jgi:hypothetical protein
MNRCLVPNYRLTIMALLMLGAFHYLNLGRACCMSKKSLSKLIHIGSGYTQ